MATSAPLRWSILGLGTAGLARARAILCDPRAHLSTVWRGRNLERLPTARVARDLPDALTDVDAVAVCSPDDAHPEQVEAALRAGRHVVCEYPLAPSEREARRLFAVAAEVGRVLHVEHIELLHAPQVIVRSHTRRDPVRSLRLEFARPGPADATPAEIARSNLARIHRIVDLCGPVREVVALTAAPGSLGGTLRHDDGVESTFLWDQSPYHTRATRIDLATAAGERWRIANGEVFRNGGPLTMIEADPLFEQDHRAAMGRVLDGRRPYVDDARILHALAVRDAIAEGRLGAPSGR